MRGPFFHGVGGVLSADIAVPEHEREVRFYSRVLSTGENPLWREDLMNDRGLPIIGLGPRSPEYEHLPLQWMPHIQVADVAASAEAALALGGTELMHARGDDGQSQWAVLADPAGAAFGLIPVVVDESNGAGHPDRMGCIAGLSLVAADVPATCEFYQQVVGWSAGARDADGVVEMQGPDGVAAAEICPGSDDDQGVPSVWMLRLPVADLAESLRRVREGGGEVVEHVTGAGHAILRDPVGVHIALESRS